MHHIVELYNIHCQYLILQSKVIAITLFVCLSVYLSVFCVSGMCSNIYIPHNTWNITRNIMILCHEVFMYFLLGGVGVEWGGVKRGEGVVWEVRGVEGAPK